MHSSTCVSSVLNLGKIGGKTWRKVGERRGENWREVGKFVGKCGEWLVEDVRKMWRKRCEKL